MEHVRNGRMLILNYANFYDNNNKNTKKPRMGSEKGNLIFDIQWKTNVLKQILRT